MSTEGGIAHAPGVGGKVAHGPLGTTAGLPWFRWNGRQRLDGGNESFTLPLFEEGAGGRGPGRSRGCARSKDRVSHVPDVFFGMREIDDLYGSGKVFRGQIPDPRCAVANDDHEASLARVRIVLPIGRATSQSHLWQCGVPQSADCLALGYLHTPQVLTLSAWIPALHEILLQL